MIQELAAIERERLMSEPYPLAKAYLPAKNHRRIGKARAVGQRTVKVIEYLDSGKVLVQVYRGKRWQREEIARELLV